MHANADAPKPLVVGFKSLKDKDNILRHTNLLRREGIYITEDTTGKVPPWMKASPPSPFKKKQSESVSSSNGSAGNRKSIGGASNTSKKILEQSDHMSSCNSDYAPSSHSGNSSSGAFTDD